MAPYRPPGRSNRSGRANADNDVFEGLPVKQWNVSHARVSLAPPVQESENPEDNKWADPPMPRDYQLLNPWTQHLLRLARSGRVGTKRKQEPDVTDEDKPEDETAEEVTKSTIDDRAYVAKKWKPVPEHMLEPEHKHFEFLAKRRRGLPGLYGPEQQNGAPVAMRRTKVQRVDASGEVAVYEVLVPEGQVIEGEITESTELVDAKPIVAAPGTAIEGVGIANEEGILVAEHLKPINVARRNRPPPKKKGGPGRGKKRVTFTNPDGTTYTTVVPNATKIVPQPGQTVKHVAKGEEATADISAEEAAKRATERSEHGGEGEGEGEEGGSGSDEGDDDGDDDDDREEGELSDDDAPGTVAATPAKPTPAKSGTPVIPSETGASEPMEDVKLSDAAEPESAELPPPSQPPLAAEEAKTRDPSSSPELPLAKSHSRSGSMADPPPTSLDAVENTPAPEEVPTEPAIEPAAEPAVEPAAEPDKAGEAVDAGEEEDVKFADGDDDLLGNLEKHLG
ncbi:hypothetical protein DOTSEDRAFT_75432 [Dothistroma septosporum NZE10]|uniref:Uncharacterized protein n=1 Tax=Dothistroma septosporum (strain NZE10 / CBS 128990) TaxID=675120 RepID=M2XGR2_DOTSN|nr:hypothetical protein DOTSEDRAFT_75432 [Dothistroma septosporum NZE10]